MKKNLISLFAGAGGLDLGLELAGFNTIIANELEPNYCETLRKNKTLSNLNENETEEFISEALSQKCFKKLKDDENNNFFKRLKHPKKNKFLQNAKIIEGDIRNIPTSKFAEILSSEDELYAIINQSKDKNGLRKI